MIRTHNTGYFFGDHGVDYRFQENELSFIVIVREDRHTTAASAIKAGSNGNRSLTRRIHDGNEVRRRHTGTQTAHATRVHELSDAHVNTFSPSKQHWTKPQRPKKSAFFAQHPVPTDPPTHQPANPPTDQQTDRPIDGGRGLECLFL